MPTVATGQVFDRYRILRWLGSSVSGESYEAQDTMLLRKVTLKLIHPQSLLPDSSRRQFFREMQGISGLHHALLAPILDYGEIDGRLYVARRFVSNGSLLSSEGRLWFRPPLSISDAIQYAHQLAQVLHYIHTRGYVHGAVTLSNVLVLRGPNLQNDPDYAPFLLADTGLAQFVRRFGPQPQLLLPVTAAPEQLGKRVIPASDQYALAVLFYSWLAGRPPFVGTPIEIQQLKLTETIPQLSTLNPLVSLAQDGIILRALSVSPEDRYPTVLAFTDALRGTLKPIDAQPVQPTPQDAPVVEFTSEIDISTEAPASVEAPADVTDVTPVEETTPTEIPLEQPERILIEPDQPITDNEPAEEEAGEAHEEPQTAAVETVLPELPDTPEPSFEAIEEEQASRSEPAYEEPEQPEQPELLEQPERLEQPVEAPDLEQAATPRRAQITEPIYFARVVITSPYAEEPYEYVLHSEEITLGRAGSSDILLDHDNLTSRHHALLRCEPQGYVLYDRRSANGVYVNGQRLGEDEGCELVDGDHISIGNYELIFRSTEHKRVKEPADSELAPVSDYELTQLI